MFYSSNLLYKVSGSGSSLLTFNFTVKIGIPERKSVIEIYEGERKLEKPGESILSLEARKSNCFNYQERNLTLNIRVYY